MTAEVARMRMTRTVADLPITQTTRFNVVVGLLIVGNALSLGLEADQGKLNPEPFRVAENFFCAGFLLELILHFYFEGIRGYFSDFGNWLDCTLVILSVVDVWILQNIGGETDLRTLSILRLLRLLRLVRIVRLFRLFKELTLIVTGFVDGMKTLTWAMAFLTILVYSFAIF